MINKYLALILCVFIMGCETVSTVTPTSTVPPEHGLVIFKLTSDTPNIGFFQYWQQVTVKPINHKYSKDYTIGFSKKGNTRSAVYIGSLPKGEYRLVEFLSGQCGAICVSSKLTLSDQIGSFIVESGAITDLGHLIYTPIQKDNALVAYGESQDNWVHNYLNDFYPQLSQNLSFQYMNGWKDKNKRMESLYNEVKAKSKGLIRPMETSQGSVLFGSYLGNVKVWQPNNGIISYDTGIQGSIESVAELKNGAWLAGSENGSVLISKDRGASWNLFDSPFLNSSIIAITPYKDKVFVTVSTQNDIGIYYRELNNSGWKLLSKHPLKFAFWTGVHVFPNSIAHQNRLVTSLPSRAFMITDMDNLTTVEKLFPGSISAFTLSRDGVMRCIATKSFAANPYETQDWGETWIKSEHSRFMSLPYFKDDTHGYGLQGAWLSGKAELSITTDGGKSWEIKAPIPYRTQYFSHLKETGHIFAWDGYNTLIFSEDNGSNWLPQ